MKIAVVSPYSLDHPGGVQSHTRELVERLNAAGESAWLVAPGQGAAAGYLERAAVPVRLVGAGRMIRANDSLAPIALNPMVAGRVQRALAGAEVVHVHEPLMPVVSWAALTTRPLVLTFHADPSPAIRRLYRWSAPLLARLCRRAAAVTAVSRVAASAVRPFLSEVEIIPNGIDAAAYQPPDVRRVPGRVAFLGRRDPRKGLEVLEAAWPRLRRQVAGATLHVLGATGTDQAGIRYLGRVDDQRKRRELAAAEVFCAPNLGGESFGIILIEGLAAGCAVVASDLPAFREAAGDEAARFFPPGDREALAAGLTEVLGDPDLAARLGEHGRERARRYDWTEVIPRYRGLYQLARQEPSAGRFR